jgi:hypothetical protein
MDKAILLAQTKLEVIARNPELLWGSSPKQTLSISSQVFMQF